MGIDIVSWLSRLGGTVASTASSSAWLDRDIVPWPTSSRQNHCQHDSAATSRHDQVALAALSLAWLGELGTYFPDQQSDSEDHCQSGSGAWGLLLQPMARLRHAFTYSADIDSRQARRHHHVMGQFTKPAKSFFSCILFWVNISIYFQLVNILF
jgi:hypothetical protein